MSDDDDDFIETFHEKTQYRGWVCESEVYVDYYEFCLSNSVYPYEYQDFQNMYEDQTDVVAGHFIDIYSNQTKMGYFYKLQKNGLDS